MLREDGAAPSLAQLARRVGCSAPALYAHFANKDDLLDQVRDRALADLRAEKQARYAAPENDPLGLLEQGGRAYVAFARQNPALYRLIFAPEHSVRTSSFRMDQEAVAPLANGIRAAQAIGYFKGIETDGMARLLWFALHGAIMMALDHPDGASNDEAWGDAEGMIDTFMQVFTHTGS